MPTSSDARRASRNTVSAACSPLLLAAGWPGTDTVSRACPTCSSSRGPIKRRSTRSPFTSVPFDEPRSWIQVPSGPVSIRQWCRETLGPELRMSLSTERPTWTTGRVNSSSVRTPSSTTTTFIG
jgi:hypothetical protein